MSTDSSLLKDDVVLQRLGPLDEVLHSGVIHVRLTFVVACCGDSSGQCTILPPIYFYHQVFIVAAVLTCDEHLCFTAACEVGQ